MKKPDLILIGCGLFTAVLPTLHLFLSVTYLFVATLIAGLITTILAVVLSGRGEIRVIGISLCAISIIGSYSLIAYDNRSGKPIKIVLPTHFQGEFSIVRDSKQGTEPEATDDFWIYRIPKSGELRTSNDRPFFVWHSVTFVRDDGSPVKAESLGTTAGNQGSKASTDFDGTSHNWRVSKQHAKGGTGQPATRPESKSESGDKPQPESEERSRVPPLRRCQK